VPYSAPELIDGVHYYDSSALHRFFEEGQIGVRGGDAQVAGAWSVFCAWIDVSGHTPRPAAGEIVF
jgi:hypothetical protein